MKRKVAKKRIPKPREKTYLNSTSNPDVMAKYSWTSEKAIGFQPTRLAALVGKTIKVWKKAFLGTVVDGVPSKVRYGAGLRCKRALVQLEISAEAERVQPENKKCRTAMAKVLAIYVIDRDGKVSAEKASAKFFGISGHDDTFLYKVGEEVKPRDKFIRSTQECSDGIHFFLTKKEALNYLV